MTDARSGAPVAGIQVFSVSGSGGGYDTTNAAGHYKLGPLYSGNYTIEYLQANNQPTYATEYYDQQPSQGTAHPVSVTAPNTVQVNELMSVGGLITGRVTNATTGAPIVGASVSTSGAGGQFGYTYTAADGTYQLTGLFAGSYTVAFIIGGYAAQYWNDKSSFQAGDPVPVQFYATTPGISAALTPSS